MTWCSRPITPAELGFRFPGGPPTLTRAERQRLDAWRATPREDVIDDDTTAAQVIALLHGADHETALLHARYLFGQVHRLLKVNIDVVQRVADALLASGSVGGAAVRRVVHGG